MLFNLYVSGLGDALNNSKLSVKLGGSCANCHLLCRRLGANSRVPQRGYGQATGDCGAFLKGHVNETRSVKNLTPNSPNPVDYSVEDETIEEVLSAKYVGVTWQEHGGQV